MTKRIRLSAIIALFIASIIFMAFGFNFINFNKQVVKADSLIAFEQGASIRLDADNNADETTGIRFTANVSETLYDSDEIGIRMFSITRISERLYV